MVVRLLLAAGAALDLQTHAGSSAGNSALMEVAAQPDCSVAVLRMLLACGASTDIRNREGKVRVGARCARPLGGGLHWKARCGWLCMAWHCLRALAQAVEARLSIQPPSCLQAALDLAGARGKNACYWVLRFPSGWSTNLPEEQRQQLLELVRSRQQVSSSICVLCGAGPQIGSCWTSRFHGCSHPNQPARRANC